MSLIGAAIAGGIEGAGKGASEATKQEAEYQDKSDLQQQYVSAVEAKDMRLAEQAQGYHVTNSATDFQNLTAVHTQDNTSAETRTAAEQSGANSRNAATIAGEKDVANIRETGANTRTAAEISARQMSDAIAHTNYTPAQDGTVYATRPNKDGTYTTQVLTDVKGAPIRGLKDVPASVLKEYDGLMLIARTKINQDPGDKEGLQMAADAIAMLRAYGGGGANVTAAPSTASVQESDRIKLLANPTPQAMSNLDVHYGAGTAAELIKQSKASATAAPGASAPIAATAAAPVAGAATPATPDAASSAVAAAPAAASAAAPAPSAGNAGAGGYAGSMSGAAARSAQYQADQQAAAAAKMQEIADAKAALAGSQLKNPTRTAANSRFGPRIDVFDQTDTGLIRRQIKQ